MLGSSETMPHYCCVPKCKNGSNAKKSNDLSFHMFPSDQAVRQLWIQKIRRDPGPSFKITKHTHVCSDHFLEGDYEPRNPYRVRRRLKKNAVPTVFAWTLQKTTRRKLFKHEVEEKEADEIHPLTPPDQHYLIPKVACSNRCETTSALSPDRSADLSHSSSDDSLMNVEEAPDKATLQQGNLKLLELRYKEKFSLSRFASSDTDIRYYTGLPSYNSCVALFHLFSPECYFLYYVGTENTSSGKPYSLISKRGPSRSLSPMEELFITLVRLRKGLPERHIGHLYNISEGQVSKIINTWISFMANRFRFLPIWPSQDHVRKSMPEAYKSDYGTLRIIVDCTEMYIEQPSASECQRETFSSYKHNNTAKGLLGIAPTGQMTFVSSLYAGRCSDKKIIRHCGLLDLLEDTDSVMVDKGFDIEEDLNQRGVSIAIPPFLKDRDQFTGEELNTGRSVASVRVHVERAVRKIKEFDILGNVIPISLAPMLEKIWFVCGHLNNFTGSLYK